MFLQRVFVLWMLSFATTHVIAAPVFEALPAAGSLIKFNSTASGEIVSQTIRITNSGVDPLEITSAVFGLTNPNNFSIASSGTNSSLPIKIPAGSSSSVVITCTPDLTSYLTYANLGLITNDPLKSTVSYTLVCTRNSTGILYESYPAKNTPMSSFGDVNVGTSKTRSGVIFNTGDTAMNISSLTFSGNDAVNFRVSQSPISPLNGGSNTYFVITCSPTRAGLLQANLIVKTNASNVTSITYGLTCNGIGNSPPTNILLDNQSITGGLAANSLIANISTTDIDLNDTHTYSLQNPSNLFFIKNNQLWTSQAIPLAVNSPYSITIRSTDAGGLFIDKTFNINVIQKIGARFSSNPPPNQLIDLGKTLVLTPTLGQTNTGQLEIIETGDLALQVSPNITGINAGDFKVSPTAMILPDGSPSQFFTIECKPAAKGIRTATLELSTNSSNFPTLFSYPLQCEGLDKTAVFTSIPPANQLIQFGKVPINQIIKKKLDITEAGNVDLNITPTIVGVNAGDFKISPNSMTLPDGSPPQSFTIECKPQTAGIRNATLQLSLNDPNSPIISYPLQCEGELQNRYVSNPPTNSIVLFNSDAQGTPVSQTIYITNQGSQDLIISSLEITGGIYASTFSVINGIAPFTIAANTTSVPFPLMLQCTPAQELLQGGFLHLKTNDPNNADVTYGLACLKRSTGAVYASLPRIGERIPFGNVPAGSIEDRQLIMFNAGDQPISISNVDISGLNANVFNVENRTFPITIESGGFQIVHIGCNPLQTGIYLATLSVTSNATVARRVSLPTNPLIHYPLTCRSGLNNPPTDIVLSNQILNKDTPANTLIANISSLDPDVGDSQFYTLQDSNDLFEIRDNQLWTKQSLPTNSSSFDIAIKSIDSGDLFIEKNFHLTVKNVVQHFLAEVITAEGVKTTVDETELITVKGFVKPLPEQVNQLGDVFVIYRYISPTNATIELPPITLLNNTPLQSNIELMLYQGRLIYLAGRFEVVLGYHLNGVENKGLATTFKVQKNQPPTDFSLSRNTLVERSPAGTVVGKFVAQDLNKDDFFRYVITQNTGAPFGYFKIVGDQLQMSESFPLNFSSNSTLNIGVRVIDSAGGFLDKTFTIKVIENTTPHIGGEIRSNGLAIRGTKDQLATLAKAQIFTANAWIQPPSIHLNKVADILYKIVYTPLEGEPQIFEGVWEANKVLSSVLDIEIAKNAQLSLVGRFEASIGYRLKDGTFEILTPFQIFRVQG
ncbi:MAG: hypothetical protein RIT27_822 [Pseudomonadota bacterium]|jgi:hypothetical protein